MATRLNAEALRAIRERSGLTVTDLARLSGISQPHISNLENGSRRATPPTIKALAVALGVPMMALFGPEPQRIAGPEGPYGLGSSGGS